MPFKPAPLALHIGRYSRRFWACAMLLPVTVAGCSSDNSGSTDTVEENISISEASDYVMSRLDSIIQDDNLIQGNFFDGNYTGPISVSIVSERESGYSVKAVQDRYGEKTEIIVNVFGQSSVDYLGDFFNSFGFKPRITDLKYDDGSLLVKGLYGDMECVVSDLDGNPLYVANPNQDSMIPLSLPSGNYVVSCEKTNDTGSTERNLEFETLEEECPDGLIMTPFGCSVEGNIQGDSE